MKYDGDNLLFDYSFIQYFSIVMWIAFGFSLIETKLLLLIFFFFARYLDYTRC